MAPQFTPVTQTAYARLGQALTGPDEAHQYALAILLGVLLDPLDDAHLLARTGWADVLDPSITPEMWLRWLAQAVGVTIPSSSSLEHARAMVSRPVGWLAGTPQALRIAIAGTLHGSKTIWIDEHVDNDPFTVRVTVFADEVSSAGATQSAASAAVEAGIKVHVQVKAGWTFKDLAESGLSFGDLARIKCRAIKHVVPGTPLDKLKELMHHA
ncbi:phage tail protein [Stomatohabitans albus]|uniref:phage tail protein n=1 Tax=Stomatohabitans albus TaxID=3110766 RepID=UPI00300DB931